MSTARGRSWPGNDRRMDGRLCLMHPNFGWLGVGWWEEKEVGKEKEEEKEEEKEGVVLCGWCWRSG